MKEEISDDSGSSLQKRFGDILRRLRVERKLSQEDLAFHSGLSRTYIAYLESGKYKPTLESLIKLAQGLEMKPSEIIRELERELGFD